MYVFMYVCLYVCMYVCLVDLPLQSVLDVEFLQQVHHVRVGPEEYVQTRLHPVAILILPR